ncbi:beta-N-acetylhexosaminidase [Phenylobacterium sp.]|uniref:beta-N-acetylhexosaminidase n=1 Tax=Phenylobacterium sp. TaxID=1871053 RepID=UPI0025FE9EF8|nr:beta-N-acetylhexosaminidase [Phenylobacterium sp.]MCA6287221.1 beta-N-acetylhexosaminidase [Phenylobacterium sp.]MCA6288966.1 beta-N-acetylhexosaminidase [Phenylobacterium sp.]MCA6310148.1 beta-N-acetylhexosaminidase [Phenylobacterium sp.]MCA6322340.1 beta-N-acetylhexosaminidase [Phenylobacterium sp.]MCA6338116.1 beta-N-acetylhexosaminidase [Phenylobacterium sp.]
MRASAAIYGCLGPRLGAEEIAFFRDVRPWGFILFARNIEGPDQVRGLVSALRETVGREDAPILIDQEGGRVQRFGPPHWRKYPPARVLANLPGGPAARREAARLGARLMADDLRALGVNVDCAPVLDVPQPGAHDIIGDRAYGETPEAVAVFGRAVAEGLLAGGVLPVIKHIPGHGRATSDSHFDLPVVEATAEALRQTDFAPFQALSDMPMAMTAHVLYRTFDPRRPATTSRRVIQGVLRAELGFSGLILSDDLSMKALDGDMTQRARRSLSAGCDVVLHCNGDMAEMKAVAAGAGLLSGTAARRAEVALARIPRRPEPLDRREAEARFDALLAGAQA